MEDLIFWWFMTFLEKFGEFLIIFEANTAYKQPQRSYLTLDLKYVAKVIHVITFCFGCFSLWSFVSEEDYLWNLTLPDGFVAGKKPFLAAAWWHRVLFTADAGTATATPSTAAVAPSSSFSSCQNLWKYCPISLLHVSASLIQMELGRIIIC